MSKSGFIIIPILLLVLAGGCNRNKYYAFSGYAQGGEWTVKLNMQGCDLKPAQILDSINSILTDVDTTLSGYNRNSILSRRNAGSEVPVNGLYQKILGISEHYRILTGGAFDVYSAPLFDIWGFGFAHSSFPDSARVDSALAVCRNHEKVNFNAIAQGFTCDLIADFLKRHSVSDYLVDIGEIACAGNNPSGGCWTVGIDTPEDGNETPGENLSGFWKSNGDSRGIVTSGNYRKFYVVDGVKYPHTIDPRTGYPVSHSLLSATVVAPTATDADALATYYMVIGFDEAKRKVLETADIEACLITSNEVWTSPGF